MKIFIDPGHGGNDNGAAWGDKYDYVEEDDLSLGISFLLRAELLLSGVDTVLMSREKDKFVSLPDRVLSANNWGADIFVSVHADAFHKETAHGISTHVHPACTWGALELAARVQYSLAAAFPSHANRGVKKSDFYVLRKSHMPAILIESEFISNPTTRRFLKKPENQLAIARAISDGITRFHHVIRNTVNAT